MVGTLNQFSASLSKQGMHIELSDTDTWLVKKSDTIVYETSSVMVLEAWAVSKGYIKPGINTRGQQN